MDALQRQTYVTMRPCDQLYIAFLVKNEHGAVHFHFNAKDDDHKIRNPYSRGYDNPGIEYHSPVEIDGYIMQDACQFLGCKCWTAGTSLWAEEKWLPGLKAHGTDWLWAELEALHRRTFPVKK